MIDELLDLSIVTNRKLRLIRERTEMNEWTRATLETMRPDWEKKELTVVFIPDDKPVELEIDPTRLAQVLTNLMTNAIKYTDPRGKITVRLTSRDDGVRIAVTDTGAGLTRDEIGRIFEMFHQSRTPHTQSVGGLGRRPHRGALAGGTARRRLAGGKPRPRQGRDVHALAAAPDRFPGGRFLRAEPDAAARHGRPPAPARPAHLWWRIPPTRARR